MAKWEAESAFVSIRDSIFNVVNMSGVGFLDSTGKSITMYRAQLQFRYCAQWKFIYTTDSITFVPNGNFDTVPNGNLHY